MCVSRSTSPVARCSRSPRPVSDIGYTSWPRLRSASVTGRHAQAPIQKPGTSTYVFVMRPTLGSIPDRFRPDSQERFAGNIETMTRPTARVLALLELLQTGGRHTVSSLAGRLAVDERTVRRYAEHLVDLGIPIDATRGRYGGYRLAAGFKLPPLM